MFVSRYISKIEAAQAQYIAQVNDLKEVYIFYAVCQMFLCCIFLPCSSWRVLWLSVSIAGCLMIRKLWNLVRHFPGLECHGK